MYYIYKIWFLGLGSLCVAPIGVFLAGCLCLLPQIWFWAVISRSVHMHSNMYCDLGVGGPRKRLRRLFPKRRFGHATCAEDVAGVCLNSSRLLGNGRSWAPPWCRRRRLRCGVNAVSASPTGQRGARRSKRALPCWPAGWETRRLRPSAPPGCWCAPRHVCAAPRGAVPCAPCRVMLWTTILSILYIVKQTSLL